MAKIDLYDPKWVDMVFAGKNKEYGAYQLRKNFLAEAFRLCLSWSLLQLSWVVF